MNPYFIILHVGIGVQELHVNVAHIISFGTTPNGNWVGLTEGGTYVTETPEQITEAIREAIEDR